MGNERGGDSCRNACEQRQKSDGNGVVVCVQFHDVGLDRVVDANIQPAVGGVAKNGRN